MYGSKTHDTISPRIYHVIYHTRLDISVDFTQDVLCGIHRDIKSCVIDRVWCVLVVCLRQDSVVCLSRVSSPRLASICVVCLSQDSVV